MSGSLFRDLSPARIDYARVVAAAPSHDPAKLRAFLAEELPYVWLDAYIAVMPHQHYVHRITVDDFEYLWDSSGDLVARGAVPATSAVEDRLVAAHGDSRENRETRMDSRLRGRPLGPVDGLEPSRRSPYDKGHAIGHAAGGVLDLNIIPQLRSVNRGGIWRRMERYCQQNAGTYYFCRPLYAGLSSHPTEIEFGLLRADGSIWAHLFKNYGTVDECEEIERLYREKIGALRARGEDV